MIHVCYGLYDKTGHYSKFTGTSILSMFENTKEKVTVHIFHDDTLTDVNRQRFQAVAEKYNQTIKFYNFDKICPEKIKYLCEKLDNVFESRFSIGTFYRLMIDKNFFGDDVSKIIYLDSDTVINLDIARLWEFSMKRYPIAAVPELYASQRYMLIDKFLINSGKVSIPDYFCAGVIVINLEKLEDDFFYKGIQWLADNPECNCFDQDILNNFFFRTYRKLPPEFNSFVEIEKRLSDGTILEKIYHYAGSVALGFDMKNPYDKLFFSYFIKSPWFDLELIENFYKIIKKIYIECQDLRINFSARFSGKERAFFVTSDNVDTIKGIFMVKDSEEFIVAYSSKDLEKLISAIQKSRGKKIFFIMANYNFVKEKLIDAGFVEKVDFLNAEVFLSDKHGYKLPTYTILKFL